LSSVMVAPPSPLTSARRATGAEMTSANEPKGRDQRFGERLDVAPGLGAKKHGLQQLVLGQGLGASLAETLAQALAMAVIMR
jgi:hypothetical protein